MAPGLAMDKLRDLPKGSVVLDPMAGSGTVIRQAADLGHSASGFDLDPLAVLMAQVWTTPLDESAIDEVYAELLARASFACDWPELKWIENDPETKTFIKYWFEEPQLSQIMRISAALFAMHEEGGEAKRVAAIQLLRLTLSRIIVTKEQAASLARDTSHSRPHKVQRTNSYDVFQGFDRSLKVLRKRISEMPPLPGAVVSLGDARNMTEIADYSVDAIVTSPPYLNAIDYLRGHRLALVWLGWTVPQIREIRSNSVGAERSASGPWIPLADDVVNAMTREKLDRRRMNIIGRYAHDLIAMLQESARVLAPNGTATYVVGNSCLKSTYIDNAAGVAKAAEIFGLHQIGKFERELPTASRYLPITGTNLAKRMRTEVVLTFSAK